jgi:hypothetical protein
VVVRDRPLPQPTACLIEPPPRWEPVTPAECATEGQVLCLDVAGGLALERNTAALWRWASEAYERCKP